MLQKCENFCAAVRRLEEALDELAAIPASTTIRDGVIQRFEFTFELSWKSLKAYMEEQGYQLASASPKAVLRYAFGEGLIDDESVWLDMLNARNLTSHVYDDAQAAMVVRQIRDQFMAALHALAAFYQKA